MFIFLLIVALIIVIIVAVSKKKSNDTREVHLMQLIEKMPGYEVAKQIEDALDELEDENFVVSYSSITPEGTALFTVSSGSEEIGGMECTHHLDNLSYKENELRKKNVEADTTHQGEYYYVIKNDNIGLLVYSTVKSKDVPPFLKIAAKVIMDSGYDFVHPEWLSESPEAQKYFNVMFGKDERGFTELKF